jgi:excisionase family DNA binding protein
MTIPEEIRTQKKALTVTGLAVILGISPKTIRKWIDKHGLPFTRAGSSIWLDPEATAKWWEEHTLVKTPQKRR